MGMRSWITPPSPGDFEPECAVVIDWRSVFEFRLRDKHTRARKRACSHTFFLKRSALSRRNSAASLRLDKQIKAMLLSVASLNAFWRSARAGTEVESSVWVCVGVVCEVRGERWEEHRPR